MWRVSVSVRIPVPVVVPVVVCCICTFSMRIAAAVSGKRGMHIASAR